MSRRTALSTTFLIFAATTICNAWQLEKDVERSLAGAWAVVSVEIYSNCAGTYNNNEVRAAGVSSKADRRFDSGELVRIDKINLKKKRLDLFLSLREPVLTSRMDGPFELFDEKSCKVQLMIDVPRSLTSADDLEGILNILQGIIEPASSLSAAESLPAWNQRSRRPYPADYEDTLARHAVWVAEQTNAAVIALEEKARRDLLRITDDIRTDKDYLAGFAAGVEDLRDWDEDDCSDLLTANLSWIGDSPPDESRTFKEGYKDGQALVFNLYLIDRLGDCLVPVPGSPL